MGEGVDVRTRKLCRSQMSKYKSQIVNWTRGCELRHEREAWAKDFLRFEKSQLVEIVPRKKKVDFRLLAVALCRVHTWFGAVEKVSIERLYLSPYVEKPLNSKVIKSFVPELRSRKCFLCFGIPMLSIYELWTLWTFCVPVWRCLFHVFISGYVTVSEILTTNNLLFNSGNNNNIQSSLCIKLSLRDLSARGRRYLVS